MAFDVVPIWLVFLGTMALVLLCIELGIVDGRRRVRLGRRKLEVSGAIVGAAMGVLAFMLAFTFNSAAGRFDARKALVIEETNAIETTWLRAGFLEDAARTEMRGLLRDYVDLRVKFALGDLTIEDGLHQTDTLHTRLWAIAETAGRRDGHAITTGLLIESLNEVIDVHLKRLSVSLRTRVPGSIWSGLYLLLAVGMIMMGLQIGQAVGRHFALELALAATFALVFTLISDLDRPQQGLLRVSQQSMEELQIKLHQP